MSTKLKYILIPLRDRKKLITRLQKYSPSITISLDKHSSSDNLTKKENYPRVTNDMRVLYPNGKSILNSTNSLVSKVISKKSQNNDVLKNLKNESKFNSGIIRTTSEMEEIDDFSVPASKITDITDSSKNKYDDFLSAPTKKTFPSFEELEQKEGVT